MQLSMNYSVSKSCTEQHIKGVKTFCSTDESTSENKSNEILVAHISVIREDSFLRTHLHKCALLQRRRKFSHSNEFVSGVIYSLKVDGLILSR